MFAYSKGYVFVFYINLFYYVLVLYMHVCKWTTCMPGAHKGQKKAPGFPELKWQAVVMLAMWVLGIKPESSAKRANALNAKSPA